MRTLTALSLPAIALLVAGSPALAAKSDAANEVTLHIDADSAIPPDRAEITVALTGSGDTEAAALAELKDKQALVAKGMTEAGLPADAIKNGDPAKVSNTAIDVEAEDDAALAACDAAAAASPAPSRKRKIATVVTDCAPPEPKFRYNASSVISIGNLALLPKIRTKQAELGLPTYNYFNSIRFFASDPAAQAKLGREQAVAKARTEADGYAATLGYHVVRMTRISNTSPPFSMRDLHTMIGFADYAIDQTVTPSFYGSATYVAVGIDFVIAPN